jgi:hypothetical protein
MNSEHLTALLNIAGTDPEGSWAQVRDDRTLTLHAAQEGVPLNVGKIRKVMIEGPLLFAENLHGDVFVLTLSSVFAGSVDPPSKGGRKAGFR